MSEPVRVVIVGGGVAGVSCAEELINVLSSRAVKLIKGAKRYSITLVSSDGGTLKRSETREAETKQKDYDVKVTVSQSDEVVRWLKGRICEGTASLDVSLDFIQGTATGIDTRSRTVSVQVACGSVMTVPYSKLCVCTGSSPKRVLESDDVVTVRDTDSVVEVASMLAKARQRYRQRRSGSQDMNPKLLVVGNGGIALDIVAGVRGVDVCWVVKHESIGDAFFDGECGAFLEEELVGMRQNSRDVPSHAEGSDKVVAPRMSTKQPVMDGASVGPSWAGALALKGDTGDRYGALVVEKCCELTRIENNDGIYTVGLSNGRVVDDVALIISAIGVDPSPNIAWLPHDICRAPDGGIAVDMDMCTSCDGVFAAGDACFVSREVEGAGATHTTWFQMRLWSQARSMGVRAAHCILGVQDQMASDLAFDLFTHATTFLGKRVILLGSFNGQELESHGGQDDIKLFSRVIGDVPGERSFIRVVIQDGKVKGAICIGHTEPSEVLENLIMDGLDVSAYGSDIVSGSLDLEDVFD